MAWTTSTNNYDEKPILQKNAVNECSVTKHSSESLHFALNILKYLMGHMCKRNLKSINWIWAQYPKNEYFAF